ncbi:hypothetical protein [Bifidobacterium sp. ESL0745]|uniref:hypothetical protein n=1 Tax=Bifidobacterium sp. ESL0745 TaxID=2983226 RepID=UPI0023F70B6E|nr:hypothetical protein [Bifidobacterium sp. ESL0745]MDF7665749.1 hypothetical protein [Bifidobacterium sp. ESL0745]
MSEISLVEYARLHGRNPDTVSQLARRGGLRTAHKVGRNWVVDADEPYPDHRRRGNGAADAKTEADRRMMLLPLRVEAESAGKTDEHTTARILAGLTPELLEGCTDRQLAQIVDLIAGAQNEETNQTTNKEQEMDNRKIVVEELVINDKYPDHVIVKIDGKWNLMHVVTHRLTPIKLDVDGLHEASPENWPYAQHNGEFVMYGLEPKRGWKPAKIGRAATPVELKELADKYHGMLEGEYRQTYWAGLKGAETSFTVTHLHVDGRTNPVQVESDIRAMGIEAANGSPYIVSVRIR